MPTPIDIDSFQHQVLELQNAALPSTWYTAAGATPPSHGTATMAFDTGVVRTADHACSLRIDHNTSAATQVRKTVSGGAITVVSFYFKTTDTTNPSARLATFFRVGAPTNGDVSLETDGTLSIIVGAGTRRFSAGDVCDGQWHRVDLKYDRTTTSGTMDCEVDGVALTQATGTVVTGNATDWNFGGTAAAAANYSVYYSDMVVSNTSGDYPLGDHICKMLEINGKGTHSLGAGAFQDEAGSTTDDFELSVDDAWDGTTPILSQTGEDYVQQTANDTAAYVEFTLEDPAAGDTTIWGVELGTLMAGEDSATTATARTGLFHSGTVYADTGTIDPTGSATVYNGYRIINAAGPGGDGWSNSELAAAVIRFGFSGDAAPDVIFNSALVEYAAPWTAGGAQDLTGALFTEAPSFFTGTVLASYDLAGSLYSLAPTFFTGAITATYDLTGTLFTKAPAFFTGTIATEGGEQTLTGTLFTEAPSFFTGTVLATYDLTGTLFAKAPTFFTGAITTTYVLSGTLFVKAPTFFTGTVSSTYALSGTLFQRSPTFFAGTITPGAVNLSGVLFQRSPTFFTGVIAVEGGPQSLGGVLFTKAPTFFVGGIIQQQFLSGTLFTEASIFFTGAVTASYDLTGVLFTKAPTFPQGAITTGPVTLLGVLFTKAPAFLVGTVSSGILGQPVADPQAVLVGLEGRAQMTGLEGTGQITALEGTAVLGGV